MHFNRYLYQCYSGYNIRLRTFRKRVDCAVCQGAEVIIKMEAHINFLFLAMIIFTVGMFYIFCFIVNFLNKQLFCFQNN